LKASPDPDYEPSAARILELKAGRSFDGGHVVAFDQMGPISLKPTAGAGWGPRKHRQRLRDPPQALWHPYVFGANDLHEDRLRVRLRPRRRGRDNLAFMAQIVRRSRRGGASTGSRIMRPGRQGSRSRGALRAAGVDCLVWRRG